MNWLRNALERHKIYAELPDTKPGTTLIIKSNSGEQILPRGISAGDLSDIIRGERGLVSVKVIGPSGRTIQGGESQFFVYDHNGDGCTNLVIRKGKVEDTSRKIKLHK